jgi:hypothetical protein
MVHMGKRKRTSSHLQWGILAWALALVALLVSACNAILPPTPAETPLPDEPTSTLTAAPPAPLPGEPSTDLCHEYQELLVSAQGRTEPAVVTSILCDGAHIDSTGQSPSRTPTLTVSQDSPLTLHFSAQQPPDEIEVRIYAGAGAAASFFRWPEELPTGLEPVGQLHLEPGREVRLPLQLGPGEYSLVVRAGWGEETDVFYALGFSVRGSQSGHPGTSEPFVLFEHGTFQDPPARSVSVAHGI